MNETMLSSYYKEYVVANLLSRAMSLIEERCKNMYIVELFTIYYDSLTELNARGKNAEV